MWSWSSKYVSTASSNVCLGSLVCKLHNFNGNLGSDKLPLSSDESLYPEGSVDGGKQIRPDLF